MNAHSLTGCTITAYLAGEIHTDWRGDISHGIQQAGLDVRLVGPVTDHELSDRCGVAIFGEQPTQFWADQCGAGVNAVRTRTLLARSDVVVVRFAAEFGEWNGALDAGRAVELGKPLISLHPPKLDHALKEVDRTALAVTRTADQVVEILAYAFSDRGLVRSDRGRQTGKQAS